MHSKRVPSDPLLLSDSAEYEDTKEWNNQVKYWWKKYRHPLKNRHTLVKCHHIVIVNNDIALTTSGEKQYIFPREQVSPLTCDEVDALLDPPEKEENV
jgi:hypothetical protein